MKLTFILKMMKGFLPNISSKVAAGLAETDKRLGTNNLAYLITKTKNKDGALSSSLSYIDIVSFTREEETGDVYIRAKYAKKPDGSLEVYGIGQLFENITGNESDLDE